MCHATGAENKPKEVGDPVHKRKREERERGESRSIRGEGGDDDCRIQGPKGTMRRYEIYLSAARLKWLCQARKTETQLIG